MRDWFVRQVLGRIWLCGIVCCVSFAIFGLLTLNLFYLFRSNAAYILANGWMAVLDGGLAQFTELLLSLVAGMAAYLVFKACEHRLVDWLTHR